jgi:deoxyribodipyrimidine photo-lyase
MPSTALVWFRRDLRVHDHPPLRAALDAHERVVPVFVLDRRLLDGRFPSANREHFLYESLRELRAALQARGGTLVLATGTPERELPRLARETGATAVYFASDVSPFAMARDRRVETALRDSGIEPVRTPGNFVADFGKLKPYAVFTPFHRAWARLPRRAVHGAPRNVPTPAGLRVGDIPRAQPESPDLARPGEQAARERMHAFLRDGQDAYADRHDRLAGGTSGLSPYLHFGNLSPRELEDRAGEPAFTRQLAWRDFYAQVLRHHPDNAHHAFRREMDQLAWTGGEDDLAAWQDGRTGYPVVDAAMRQLQATGWMHNRARLIAACFLVKDLHVDWRAGERHFMRLLACGDVAQNNGNWQWISSVGVDPAPVSRRLYNPVLQQRRHDPDGEYVRRWVPELRDVPLPRLATPHEMTDSEQREAGCVIGRDYPAPIVDHAVERERTLRAYAAVRDP